MNILSPCFLFTVVTSLVREGLVVAEGRTFDKLLRLTTSERLGQYALFKKYLFIYWSEKENKGKDRGRKSQADSTLSLMQGSTWGSTSWPQDHDLNWNQESHTRLTEPLRHPVSAYSLNQSDKQFTLRQSECELVPVYPHLLRRCVLSIVLFLSACLLFFGDEYSFWYRHSKKFVSYYLRPSWMLPIVALCTDELRL